MQPGLYTELFFLDEATALAAGHRPCYECQRDRAVAFRNALIAAGVFSEKPLVRELNDQIAGEKQVQLMGRAAPTICSPRELPDGAMYEAAGDAFVIWSGKAWRWSFGGYVGPEVLHEMARLLTPTVTVQALANGYCPAVHPSLHNPDATGRVT